MQAVGILLVVLVLVWLGVNLVKTPDIFFRVFLIGISQGALLALVALGYTLVYGILELINFAHGDVFMIGGMISASIALEGFGMSTDASPPSGRWSPRSSSRSWWPRSGAASSTSTSSGSPTSPFATRRAWRP